MGGDGGRKKICLTKNTPDIKVWPLRSEKTSEKREKVERTEGGRKRAVRCFGEKEVEGHSSARCSSVSPRVLSAKGKEFPRGQKRRLRRGL